MTHPFSDPILFAAWLDADDVRSHPFAFRRHLPTEKLQHTPRWRTTPDSDEVYFESIKASLDSVPPGTKMILNSGLLYRLFLSMRSLIDP
jgi:hypothetical protein